MLSDIERAVLDIESRYWRYAATKEARVRQALGLSPTRYYQVLAALIDRADAVEYAPVTISRLQAGLGRRPRSA